MVDTPMLSDYYEHFEDDFAEFFGSSRLSEEAEMTSAKCPSCGESISVTRAMQVRGAYQYTECSQSDCRANIRMGDPALGENPEAVITPEEDAAMDAINNSD